MRAQRLHLVWLGEIESWPCMFTFTCTNQRGYEYRQYHTCTLLYSGTLLLQVIGINHGKYRLKIASGIRSDGSPLHLCLASLGMRITPPKSNFLQKSQPRSQSGSGLTQFQEMSALRHCLLRAASAVAPVGRSWGVASANWNTPLAADTTTIAGGGGGGIILRCGGYPLKPARAPTPSLLLHKRKFSTTTPISHGHITPPKPGEGRAPSYSPLGVLHLC